jgi:hypothetical protein
MLLESRMAIEVRRFARVQLRSEQRYGRFQIQCKKWLQRASIKRRKLFL